MTASRGHASEQAGLAMASGPFVFGLARCRHSSHFTIFGVMLAHSNFGTSNGHATWQYRQPMQLSLSYATTPPAAFWRAPAMHTEVQAGSTQCMHCIFMNDHRSCPSCATWMMFLVVADSAIGAS